MYANEGLVVGLLFHFPEKTPPPPQMARTGPEQKEPHYKQP